VRYGEAFARLRQLWNRISALGLPSGLGLRSSDFVPAVCRSLSLELTEPASYCRRMKRISFLLVTLALWAPPALRAQDAATQERLDKINGDIRDLTDAQEALRKQIAVLVKEVDSLREQAAKPSTSYARPEDLNRLADAVKEVDRKRMDDAEKTHTELLKLRKLLEAPVPSTKKPPTVKPSKDNAVTPTPPTSDKGFEYVIQPGDTLSAIVQAYKEKNIKVTVNQIVAANPGLKPERLKEGQKIFIPAPQ
jgi:LysM repeat protein